MIRPININLNAAHPELPLVEATTFVGAPSSVFIRGVPKAVGNWSITAVSVAVTYPDNTTTARAAVESAEGVWVATIPGTATSGRTAAGFKIMADGIDENGAAVTGYVLGFADFSVLSFTPVPAPGGTFYLLRYFDQAPATPKEGDAAKIDGVLKFYNGSAWEPFAAPPTLDDTVTEDSANAVKSSGIWSAIWGALSALPTGFTSLYDWVVSQLAGKASTADVDPLLFAQYYPEGNVKSAAEFTPGIKYGSFDDVHRTVSVLPFCNTGDSADNNSSLVGRVVIPPYVDASGNGYISDDGTRYKVVGVSGGSLVDYSTSLTDIIAPNTVTTVGNKAFSRCTSLTSVSIPAAQTIGEEAFAECLALTSVSIPAAQTIGEEAFTYCISLTSVSLPAATNIGFSAFKSCGSLASVDFGDTPRSSVPSLDLEAFSGVPNTCKIIVPYSQYDEWIAASGWSALPQEFVRHAEKADKPTTFTTGNLAALDADGNPTDSTIPAVNVATKASPAVDGHIATLNAQGGLTDGGETPDDLANYALATKTIRSGEMTLDNRASNAVTVSATLSPNTLTINFPTAPTGKLRDFAMRLNIAAGVTAPEIAWPQGVTLENNGGEVPEIADGGTGGSSTILYFSETENNGTTAKFLVKGEALTAITQA